LDTLELDGKDIILAISWGADSMVVASQILYYFWKNELDLKKVHIAHCNHKIRPESEDEAKFMSEIFSGLDFHLYERKWWNDDENSLRNRRYSQFSSLQKSTKASYIFLGHHLNDRVESTFLNLMRGAWINGFLNMREVENHHLLPNECKVCRPLLNSTKSEILNICNEAWIPFFEDKTNQDVSVSKRNRVRNQILNPVSTYGTENWEENKFLESFAWIYKQLENIEDNKLNESLKPMPSFPLWNAEFSYLWENNILKCNENDIFDLFHTLKIQTSATVVNERKNWLNQWKNWYKYIWWVYFFIHEKQLFIVKADKDFWRRKNNSDENILLRIESMDDIRFFRFDLEIPRDELIWWEVRLPQEWDIFAGKKRNRRSLNQKIPMWWRDWIPLAIKDGKVIHMWKNIWK
jgi:tRNA(Ile)-lysidine synthetase-like protein